MDRIVKASRSIIVAADAGTQHELVTLCKALKGVPGIGGVKLGFSSLAAHSIKAGVSIVRHHLGSDCPVIYDHQKAGNDIPDTGVQFARMVKEAGVNAVILFPFTGPKTQEAWTKATQDAGLGVIVGGMMTHPAFLVSEGGYIADDAPHQIYHLACRQGVQHFVVPGNKLSWLSRIRGWLTGALGEGNFVLYAPGFITQGGDVSEAGKIAGDEWHAIVGSGIYKQPTQQEQHEAAVAVTRQLTLALA